MAFFLSSFLCLSFVGYTLYVCMCLSIYFLWSSTFLSYSYIKQHLCVGVYVCVYYACSKFECNVCLMLSRRSRQPVCSDAAYNIMSSAQLFGIKNDRYGHSLDTIMQTRKLIVGK